MRRRLHNPTIKEGVQTPGKLTGYITTLLMIVDVLLIMMLFIAVQSKDRAFIIVTLVLVVFLTGIIVFLKHAYNMSYQENSDYFILKTGKKEFKVHYDNIVNWKHTYNQISILEKSKEKYVHINIRLFKPELLLRKLADMSFDEKFYTEDPLVPQDNNREIEIVSILSNLNYGYLIEDYIEVVNKRLLENNLL